MQLQHPDVLAEGRDRTKGGKQGAEYTFDLAATIHQMVQDLIDLWHPPEVPRPKTEAWLDEKRLCHVSAQPFDDRRDLPLLELTFPEKCVVCLHPPTHHEPWTVRSNVLTTGGSGTTALSLAMTRYNEFKAALPGVPYCDEHKPQDNPEHGHFKRARWARTHRWDPHLSTRAVAVWSASDKPKPTIVAKSLCVQIDNPQYLAEFCAANELPLG